jgi:hypothetical protein
MRMSLYCNFPREQRCVHRLVSLYNANEQLWQRLEGRRRRRRQIFSQLSPNLQKQLDLLDFASAAPQDCVGRIEES